MNDVNDSKNGSSGHGSYFFLSYAHFHPLAEKLIEDPAVPSDEWVRTFFRDLTDAVRLSASPPLYAPGFFDQEIAAGSDWKAVLSTALSTAEVFVPLFSPDYITKSWPGREWAVFEHRMKSAGVSDPLLRFVPVLWTPLSADQRPRGLQEALDLAPAIAARAYEENGLRALLRIRPYYHLYQMIVKELAKRIVALAEKAPVGPSAAQDIDEVDSVLAPKVSAAAFAIVVAAPASHEVPAGTECSAYGHAPRAWQPFGRDQLPLADCAKFIAERLDFAAEVFDIGKSGGAFVGKPGVLLIDPRYLVGDERLDAFRVFARELPPWALPVIVPDPSAAELTQRVRISLEQSMLSGSALARRGLQGVSTLREFLNLMPFLVAQAERDYLRHGPIKRSAAPSGSRPLLADQGGRARPNSPQSSQENPVMESSAEGSPSA